jgi:hypothetical protein
VAWLLLAGCGTESTDPTIQPAFRKALPPADQYYALPADPPFYARVERPYVAPHDATMAAIIFYRSSACVPADFNLLDFFDVPGAFGCPLSGEGREWRANGEPPFTAPWLSILRGGPIAIWFVSWPDLSQAAADDVLTRTEIEALPSLRKGTADSFHEWLEPAPTRSPSRTVIEAQGVLEGGGSFVLRYLEQDFVIVTFNLSLN